jgi:hypothetical protein
MAHESEHHHHHHYPRKLGRFINLEGGLYGQVELVAIDPFTLEFGPATTSFA